jgi:hypothetical protein
MPSPKLPTILQLCNFLFHLLPTSHFNTVTLRTNPILSAISISRFVGMWQLMSGSSLVLFREDFDATVTTYDPIYPTHLLLPGPDLL